MSKSLLIIGHVWPEPKSSAAGSRMMQLIETFQHKNYDITFATSCAKSENAFDLTSIGIEQVGIELNASSFDVFVQQLNPQMVLFDRFMTEEQFGWRVAEQCPNALRILDTEDLHCLRKGRQQACKAGKTFSDEYLFNDIAKRELASIFRCDLSLIISEVEMKILKENFKVPDELLLYLPFMLEEITEERIKNLSKFQERTNFITIGNFLHEPNYDAILFLKESIWPIIKKQLPDSELHVYGAYASQKVNQLHNTKEGFIIKGFVDDVDVVIQNAKICLAPLRFGAGLKGKLIDAMQNGTPCVMTSIAAEGMFGDCNPNGIVEDAPEVFAKNAVELYRDESLWNEKQKVAIKIINQRFNKIKFQNRLFLKIEELRSTLQHHRLYNFTGQMLQHHTMQSTKYMGKWIEEKNK
ncbi:MAG TPA: glycosyltransferase [Aquaticitalea sp.]|nr:glycosyltransferase [Aquaticitalea sp.]